MPIKTYYIVKVSGLPGLDDDFCNYLFLMRNNNSDVLEGVLQCTVLTYMGVSCFESMERVPDRYAITHIDNG